MKKKLRIFINKKWQHVIEYSPTQKNKTGFDILSLALKIIKFTGLILFELCFLTGKKIFEFTRLIYIKTGSEIHTTRESLLRRLQKLKTKSLGKNLIVISIFVIGCSGFFVLLSAAAKGFEIKGLLFFRVFQAKNFIEKAKNNLENSDFKLARVHFNLAYSNFEKSRSEIFETQNNLSSLLKYLPGGRNTKTVLIAAEKLTDAGQDITEFLEKISQIRFSPQGLHHETSLQEIWEISGSHLNNSLSKISEASDLLEKIDNLPASREINQEFHDIKAKILVTRTTLNSFKEIFEIGKYIASGEKKILMVFQNNNELRATGGFIGTYGFFKLVDGKIEKMKISSVYDLDGQLKDKITPPLPMLNLNNRWYLRDSNWFASWPMSAKKISYFYEKEGGETPDIVMAFTPDLVVKLLEIVGPIYLSAYDTTFDAENFIEKAQIYSTQSTFSKENQPKQILADLFPVILQKLADIKNIQKGLVLSAFLENLNSKHTVLFFKKKELQEKTDRFNWAGSVKETDRDYLQIVTSNLGGTKTDLYVKQNVILKSYFNKAGNILNELTITRTNELPKLEKTNNLSFIRIFVPKNSIIENVSGFDFKSIDSLRPNTPEFKTDPDIYEWERTATTHVLSGTTTYTESGKTVFANWQNLEGNSSKQIKISYKLPFKLKSTDRHSLLWQKQIGTVNQTFTYKLNILEKNIDWANFEPSEINSDELEISGDLNTDKFFGIILKPSKDD